MDGVGADRRRRPGARTDTLNVAFRSGPSGVELLLQVERRVHQLLVLCEVGHRRGIGVLLHQLLFRPEVQGRVLDDAIEHFAEDFLGVTSQHVVVQAIDELHELLVLLVDLVDADGKLVVPGDE